MNIDTNEINQATNTKSQSKNESIQPTTTAKPVSHGFFSFVLISLLIINLGSNGYLWFLQSEQQQESENIQQLLKQRVTVLSNETIKIQSQLTQYQQQLSTTQQQINNSLKLQSQLNELQQQFINLDKTNTTTRLMLSEIEQTLQFAHNRLELLADLHGSIQLVNHAYQLCLKILAPEIHNTCQQLLQARKALSDETQIDPTSKLNIIANLKTKINQQNIPIQTHIITATKQNNNKIVNSLTDKNIGNSETTNYQKFYSYWQNVKTQILVFLQQHLIRIHRLDDDNQPIYNLAGKQAIQFQLQLLTSQAQWALVRQSNELYHQTLSQTEQLVSLYLIPTAPITKEITTMIMQLKQITITPPIQVIPPVIQEVQNLQALFATEQNSL